MSETEDEDGAGDDAFDDLLRDAVRSPSLTPPSRPTPSQPGERLIDRYVVGPKLGAGGMGAVYKARDEKLRRWVALKMLHADRSRALLREARAASAFEHPNVVTVYDVAEHDGQPFIVMELIEGRSLGSLVDDASLPQKERLRWIADVASALAAAHARGLIHGDVKPDNVMLRADGCIKVLDFGIARLTTDAVGMSDVNITATGDSLNERAGTPRYMAPERVIGGKSTKASDQFAWGVLAYELLAGHAPWEASTMLRLVHAMVHDPPKPLRRGLVRPAVEAVILRALDKDPEARFASMSDVVASLRATSAGWSSRRLVVGLAFALALFAVAAVAWQLSPPSGRPPDATAHPR